MRVPTTQGKRKVVEISNFTASAEPMIDTVEVHCHSQCNSTTCCQENYKVISYNPLQDQLPNTCLDQTNIRQKDPQPSRTECKSYTATGVLLAGDQAAHHFLGNCYSAEVTGSQKPQSSVGASFLTIFHNNDAITSTEDQIILESWTNKALAQDHLKNFRDLFKLGCGMINNSKTLQ